MKDELVSFETARLAKEKGFDIASDYKYYNCPSFQEMQYGSGKYWEDELGYETIPEKLKWLIDFDPERPVSSFYQAPTQSLLQRWLREVHLIIVDLSFDTVTWGYRVFDPNEINDNFSDWRYDMWDYEGALEAGLQEALKLIKI